jgi:hypothetical protein
VIHSIRGRRPAPQLRILPLKWGYNEAAMARFTDEVARVRRVKINVFEGARRVGLIIAGLWVLAWAIAAVVYWNQTIHVRLVVPGPDEPAQLLEANASCGRDDATELITLTTQAGTKVFGSLCFKAHEAQDGRMLIPFRQGDVAKGENPSRWWMGAMFDPDIRRYTERTAKNFRLTPSDEKWIDARVWPERIEAAKTGMAAMFGGLAFMWGLAWAIGWVVRGFLGIPRGRDTKPDPEAPLNAG